MGAMLSRSAALLSLVAGAGLAPFGAPQGGYVTRDFPSLGLEMPIARDYRPLPIQPTDRWSILRYRFDSEEVVEELWAEFTIARIDRLEPQEVE